MDSDFNCSVIQFENNKNLYIMICISHLIEKYFLFHRFHQK